MEDNQLPEPTAAEPVASPEPAASEPQAETTKQSMEDTIRETYRTLSAQDDSEAEPQARDPTGKFSKPAAPAAPAAAQTLPEDAYPKSWKPEHAEAWKALPPTVRAEVHRREQNFLDGIKQYREPAAFGQSIGEHMLPHVETMRAVGVTPQVLTRDLMTTWSTLVRGSPEQKASVLLQVAQQYGIDITSLAGSRDRESPQPGSAAISDPAVTQRISRLESALQSEAQERANLLAEDANRELATFVADPANEHVKSVRNDMAQLLASGAAKNLKDAYDKAIWMNPDVRAKVQAKVAEDQRKQQAAEAAAAKKAAATNVARRGTPPQATKPGSMEDTIRNTYRRLNGSA